jgi:hypothetical protein
MVSFSTIDFHSGTQKLAVGTHEGAVIMYARWYNSRMVADTQVRAKDCITAVRPRTASSARIIRDLFTRWTPSAYRLA